MKLLFLLFILAFARVVRAEETTFLDAAPVEPQAQEQTTREPAAAAPTVPSAPVSKRNYPGSADEDDLQVQAHLPDAGLRIDARSVQREVFKTLYNQDLKEDNRESVEE